MAPAPTPCSARKPNAVALELLAEVDAEDVDPVGLVEVVVAVEAS